jgi:hypothetical protein
LLYVKPVLPLAVAFTLPFVPSEFVTTAESVIVTPEQGSLLPPFFLHEPIMKEAENAMSRTVSLRFCI